MSARLSQIAAFLGALMAAGFGAALAAVRAGFLFCERWLFAGKKALYGLAVTRIIFGVAMLGLMLANFSTRLYTFGSGSAWNGELASPASDFPKIWLFSLFHLVAGSDFWFTFFYVLLMALIVAFTLGWRFRVVHPFVFVGWVSFIEMNEMVGDQSDNLQRIALLLFFFADPAARWSLDARRRATEGEWFEEGTSLSQIGTVLHNLALVALVMQLAFVYVSGGLYKAQGNPWSGGWAVYDPLHTARFGTWPELSDLATAWGPAVAAASWGSVLLQIGFPLLLLVRPTRLVALAGILTFHLAIAVLMGLPWFSLTMIAVDAVFIRDRSWQRLAESLKRRWAAARLESPDLRSSPVVVSPAADPPPTGSQ